jgi:hypothetical protein
VTAISGSRCCVGKWRLTAMTYVFVFVLSPTQLTTPRLGVFARYAVV